MVWWSGGWVISRHLRYDSYPFIQLKKKKILLSVIKERVMRKQVNNKYINFQV